MQLFLRKILTLSVKNPEKLQVLMAVAFGFSRIIRFWAGKRPKTRCENLIF